MPSFEIRAIRLRGFRGMLAPFELTLPAANASCIVHGRNGHGKSSITDAWEFVHRGKIEHLAKEGAGVDSYAHRRAPADESYVELEFADASMGTLRCYTDGRATPDSRAAKQKLNALRAAAPHPCHIRFEDLSRFVYLTKTERHDALATLMGFTKQVETQKSLRRVQKQLSERAKQSVAVADKGSRDLAALIGNDSVDDAIVLAYLNAAFVAHQAPEASTDESVDRSVQSLASSIETDARAVELSAAETFNRALGRLATAEDLAEDISKYALALTSYRSAATTTVNALLVRLFDVGADVLSSLSHAEGDPCPLCGQSFTGSLVDHVASERQALIAVRTLRENVKTTGAAVAASLPPRNALTSALSTAIADAVSSGAAWPTGELEAVSVGIDAGFEEVRALLSVSVEQLDDATIARLTELATNLGELQGTFERSKKVLTDQIEERASTLRTDTRRADIVGTHARVTRVVARWRQWRDERTNSWGLSELSRRFDAVVEDYVAASIADVQARFSQISEDVEKFFGILEANTPGIQKPALRLLLDQDRAVVLEVEFRGEVISPAYKFLSESQLNSFGLAVFLASARRFNPAFPFLILDDVVNSFDGQKRPQVIRLLKQEFAGYQILLLTHDRVWWAQLTDAFKSWSRFHIVRYEPAVGPVLAKGRSDIESIEHHLDVDDPRAAGGLLGPFLERRLQELCERFQVLVTYNQRNEYTLAPLLTRYRVRVSEKLGAAHAVSAATTALESDLTFRNFMAHWKDPEIEVTTDELRIVVERWNALEALLTCANESCHGFPAYDGSSAFVCDCGTLRLSR